MKQTISRAEKGGDYRGTFLPLALFALSFLLSFPSWAANYVIKSGNHYLVVGTGNNIADATSFNPNTCIWTGVSGGNLTNNGTKLRYTGTVPNALGTGGNVNWTINGNQLYYAGRYNNYGVRYNNGWTIGTGTNYNVIYEVGHQHYDQDNPTAPTISAAISSGNNGVQLSHTNLSGTYRVAYDRYSFDGTNHFWYNNSDHNEAPQQTTFNNSTPGVNYTWSIVSGAQYATISDAGLLRSRGNATTQQTVQVKLTTTHTASGYSNEQTYNVQIQDHPATTVTAGIGDYNIINHVGDNLTLRGFLSGNYVASYTTYTIGYQAHNLSNGQDYGYNTPQVNGGFEYHWSLSGEGAAYATIASTLANNPQLTYTTDAGRDVMVEVNMYVTHPDFPELNVAAAPFNVTLYSTSLAAPTISYNEGTHLVTLSTVSEGTTYYTTDGSDPRTSGTRIAYTAPFSVTTPKTIRASVERWGNWSSVSEETIHFQLGTPDISFNTSGVMTVSLANAPAGTSFRYTTDGSEPTASSPLYNNANKPTVTNGTTVKVKAFSTTGYDPSEVAVARYEISSGADGTTVTINDYEDHTWTYYSGVEIGDYNTKNEYKGRLYSPNPRNVKITYLGKGKMHQGNDNSSLIDVPSTTRVSVGLGTETENVFVYYKTLERNANNRYEYTTIPNPFQVRPTYANDNTTKWRGFRYWRIKSISNGNIYAAATGGTALAVGATLNAETTYYFVPSDVNGTGYTPNCTSMEIELEAVWARAYVNNNQNVGFERNFRVITANSDNAPTKYTYPTTYSSIYPNGCTTADGTTLATGARYRVGANLAIDNDTKFEYIILRNTNNNSTLDAACHNLVIGRGVVGYNNGLCATEIRGYAANSMDFTLRIESGSYTTFHALRNNGGTYSGVCKVRSILGCDYDRAKNDNSKLDITTNMWMGQACKFSTANNRTQGFYKCWIKSGNLLSGVTVNGAAGNDGNGGTKTFYYGTSGNQNSTLHLFPRYLYMEGGQIAGLAGGLDDRTVTGYDEMRVYLKMTGGYVRGPIYGAGAYAPASGCRNYILVGGEVGGWVAAGCNGIGESTTEGQNDGTTTGSSFVYVGGNVAIGYKGALINSVEGGNVFGAGRGASGKDYAVGTIINSNVVVADNARIEKNVYGGGNYGLTTENATLYIAGGTVDGNVFGGSNMKEGKTPTIYMTDGLVKSGIFGGSNTQGTISQNVTMQIVGGQVGTPTVDGNIHGGGKGSATVVNGKIDLTIGGTTPKQPVIYGNVYGGSESGDVNGNADSANNSNTTAVTLNNGVINGSLYGGAWGKDREAFVYGPVSVTVNGGTVTESVFGCNNAQGKPRMGVTVTINHTDPAPAAGQYALKNVFGGGNQADYTAGTPIVTVNNCDNSIEYVYGGGNMATVPGTNVTIHGGNVIGNVFGGGYGANITTNGTHVTIDGGRILNVFGGSNNGGTITGGIVVDINESNANATACPINIDNVYGGGNKAASAAGQLNIGCCSHIGSVYGGANQANITGNINLNIVAGHIDNVFGGNNETGTISGSITVTVNDNNSACGMLVGNVYGGGNKAAYGSGANFPVVNIQNGHLTGSVFGGGLGASAVVTGSPRVTIGQPSAGTVHVDGNVFGGGDAANVVGTPVVLVQNCNTMIGTKDGEGNWNALGGSVYGGGNAAHVTGAGNGTNVTINGGDINRVFGGGNGEVRPANVQGNAVTTIHAGNIHQAFAGSNMQGTIDGSAAITVDHSVAGCPEKIDEVYGGGNQAAGNAGVVNVECGAWIGDVYGGANAADVNSNISLVIRGGHIDNVFGGNNTAGAVNGTISVIVDWDDECGGKYLGNVYGGGNLAQYSAPAGSTNFPLVEIRNGVVSESVFGGGKGSETVGSVAGMVTGNPQVRVGVGACSTDGHNNGTHVVSVGNNVYGGGNAAPVNGSTNVVVNGNQNQSTSVTGYVFGGGFGPNAEVRHDTFVHVVGNNASVGKNVYGGGHGGPVRGNTHVVIGED